MANFVSGPASEDRGAKIGHRGFSILDIVVLITAFTVVAGVVIPSVLSEYEMARLSDCKAGVELMKAVAQEIRGSRCVPTPNQFWAVGFPNAEEGDYYYIVDEQDANKGHGNDLDGCDESDPDNSPRCRGADITFVVLCNHDHGALGKYVYATEQDAPTVVEVDGDDPGYKAWLTQNNTDGSQKEGKEPKIPKKK